MTMLNNKFFRTVAFFLLLGFSLTSSVAQTAKSKRKETTKSSSRKYHSNQVLAQKARDACEAFEQHQYNKAIQLMDEYKLQKQLPSYGYYMLTLSCLKTAQNERCVAYGNEWQKVDPNSKDEECRAWIYSNQAVAHANLNQFEESNNCFKQAAALNKKVNKKQYARDCESIGYNYWSLQNHTEARTWFERSAQQWLEVLKVNVTDIQQGKVNNEELGRVLYDWSMACFATKDYAEGKRYLILSAQCHYNEAIEYCTRHNVAWQ